MHITLRAHIELRNEMQHKTDNFRCDFLVFLLLLFLLNRADISKMIDFTNADRTEVNEQRKEGCISYILHCNSTV